MHRRTGWLDRAGRYWRQRLLRPVVLFVIRPVVLFVIGEALLSAAAWQWAGAGLGLAASGVSFILLEWRISH